MSSARLFRVNVLEATGHILLEAWLNHLNCISARDWSGIADDRGRRDGIGSELDDLLDICLP